MKKDIYVYLARKIRENVDYLNNNLTHLECLRKKEYYISVPGQEEFIDHGESINVSYDNHPIRKIGGGRPIIAFIRKEKDNGLDGIIYDVDKKASELLEKTIHSFAHKYHISTGDLL